MARLGRGQPFKPKYGLPRWEITQQTIRTQTGKARISITSTQTLTGKARVSITTSQTLTGKARITLTTTETLTGRARITATTSQTQAGKARITVQTTQTQSGKASIAIKQFQVDTGGTLKTSLISYWRMQGDSSDFYDGNNGTDTAMSYGSGSGKVLQGANFSGSGAVIVANSSNMNSLAAMSMAFWMQPQGSPEAFEAVIVRSNVSDPGGHLMWYANANTTLKAGIVTSNNAGGVNADSGLTRASFVNAWVHFAMTYDGANLKLYVNNVLKATTAATGTVIPNFSESPGVLAFGTENSVGSTFFQGYLDEIGLWGKALSTQEVADLYNGGSGQTMVLQTITTTTQTQSGKARITGTTTQTETGKGRISITSSQTLTGKARITKTTAQTETGLSRITKTTAQTQTGKSRITLTSAQTLTGKARITKTTAQTQSGKASITIPGTSSQTQTGKSRITTTTTQTQNGKARIAVTQTKTQTGKATIANFTTQLSTGKAYIYIPTAYTSKYTPQGTAFSSKYASQGTVFEPKYVRPHP